MRRRMQVVSATVVASHTADHRPPWPAGSSTLQQWRPRAAKPATSRSKPGTISASRGRAVGTSFAGDETPPLTTGLASRPASHHPPICFIPVETRRARHGMAITAVSWRRDWTSELETVWHRQTSKHRSTAKVDDCLSSLRWFSTAFLFNLVASCTHSIIRNISSSCCDRQRTSGWRSSADLRKQLVSQSINSPLTLILRCNQRSDINKKVNNVKNKKKKYKKNVWIKVAKICDQSNYYLHTWSRVSCQKFHVC